MLFSKSKVEVLAVAGMSCAHCEQAVEKAIGQVPGVAKVKADHGKNRVEVSYKGAAPDMAAVRKAISDLGYEVSGA